MSGDEVRHRRPAPRAGRGADLARGAAFAGLLGREVLRLGRDRVARSPVPPRRIGDVDAPFLAAVLGSPVTSVEIVDATGGTTDRARLKVHGEDVPPTVFVKMPATVLGARLFGNLAHLGGSEIGFYRDLRPALGLEAPAVLGWVHDAATGRYVLVLEDLEARGCTFGDVLVPFTVEQARAVVDTLAALHGAHWRTPRLDRASRTRTRGASGPRPGTGSGPLPRGPGNLAWLGANGSDPLIPIVTVAIRAMARRMARTDPALVPAGGRAILRRYRHVARELDAGPPTVLHGDPHPGNCYFVDGRAGLLDWQVVRRGNPVRDVAYALVLGLDPGSRRRHERALLDRYRQAFAAAGGALLGTDELWTTYRRMAAYPYVAATFTAGLGGLQDEPTGRQGLERAVVAIEDLDTVDALDSLA